MLYYSWDLTLRQLSSTMAWNLGEPISVTQVLSRVRPQALGGSSSTHFSTW